MLPTNSPTPLALAASVATKEEIDAAREKGGTVQADRRLWRPQVTSRYKEPDCVPDPLGDMEVLFKDYGKPLWASKAKLPPRDDIIEFDPTKHEAEFAKNIRWTDCPEQLRPRVEQIVKDFWDTFAEEGVKNFIRGALFHVDTGEVAPINIKPPRYGPHESRIINDLVEKLENNGIIEDDDGPWGAPVVLAAKANQEHIHWSKYTWRLCVSYRRLNAVTRPFTFPIVRCDDAVREIGGNKYFITMDLDSGYWQVKCEERSKAKLAFYTPTGKKRFKSMPMGATNAHPVFVALVAKFKEEWDKDATAIGLKDFQSQVIVDDIILTALTQETLLQYFVCVLKVLRHYRCSAKLSKCRFFPQIAEFVGLDIRKEGNSPARSKFEAFAKLGPPNSFTDLNMLIGCFGFYQEFLPLYETRIKRWRELQKLRPLPGTPRETERQLLQEAWSSLDDKLLEELKQGILSAPILQRPNSNARFYLKTDWSKEAMGAALLQPREGCPKALEAMNKEIAGEDCRFDLIKSGLRLHPIAFISRRTSEPEKSYHSYVGEACAGIWAIEKFRPYLFGREFTWLTDCAGLRKFFEGDDIPTHMIQRWRMQLLRYDFTIHHRPGRMMFECDLLSRYNQDTDEWRREAETDAKALVATSAAAPKACEPPGVAFSNARIQFTGLMRQTRKPLLEAWTGTKARQEEQLEEQLLRDVQIACDPFQTFWIIGSGRALIVRAAEEIGWSASCTLQVSPGEATGPDAPVPIERAQELALELEESPDWLFITSERTWEDQRTELEGLLDTLIWKGLKCALLCANKGRASFDKSDRLRWGRWLSSTLAEKVWSVMAFSTDNLCHEGGIETTTAVLVLGDRVWLDILQSNWKSRQMDSPRVTGTTKPMTAYLQEFNLPEPLLCREETRCEPEPDEQLHAPKCVSIVQFESNEFWPVFDPWRPAPNAADKTKCGPSDSVLIRYEDSSGQAAIRELSTQELAAIWGYPAHQAAFFLEPEQFVDSPPYETWRALLSILWQALGPSWVNGQTERLQKYENEGYGALRESTTANKHHRVCTTMINRWTTIPLPTHRQWADEIDKDRDLLLVKMAVMEDTVLERHRLANKKYHDAWNKGQLEYEEGLLYHTGEPKITCVRQLRRRVVPKSLRQIVITAYHATPLAGHSGVYRTYWRIASRYWWPRMFLDVKEAVTQCAHCKLANAVGRESQAILEAISTDAPFDVIAIDVWSPGDIPDKYGNVKALTSLDTMTGFASAAVLTHIASENVARHAFASFFVPNGLPKLILLDSGSENKGALVEMCNTLGIKYHVVSPEAHNGILCERFHRYLNKVQKIVAADTQSFAQWAQGLMFATYSWNAAPVDGTDIVRSFVAKGRVFPFPLQIAEDANPPRIPSGQGETALEHLETNFPLWAQQSRLLQILIAERRERHRDMRNEGKSQRQFNPGDLVIIRKQVKSDATKGAPAKQKFKWKGIYRVLEKAGDKSYRVQKLPTIQGRGTPGTVQQYSSAVMEKIPSSLVVSKHLDTSDTRLVALDQPLIHNPLEQSLGFAQYGKYVRAPEGSEFAFDKIEDLWSIDLDPDSDEEDRQEPTTTTPLTANQCVSAEELYQKLSDSRDKLMIIKLRTEPKVKHDWYVVQVDWDNCDELKAKQQGIYMARWLIPHHSDSKTRKLAFCRFWPEIHELLPNGDLGPVMRMVSPPKATDEYLKSQNWDFYEWEVDLLRDGLVGPFDYCSIRRERHHIPADVWNELTRTADPALVDLGNIYKVVAKR